VNAVLSLVEGVRMSLDQVDAPRKRPSELTYAEARLSAWAAWAKERRHDLGYPSISTLYKAMREKATPIGRLVKRKFGPELTARGTESVVFFESRVDEPPEAVAEVETVVNKLPGDLRLVVTTDYFTRGPIEAKAKRTPWKRARYSQLLESAKYAVFVALDSRTLDE
jgi:hypothetical protein